MNIHLVIQRRRRELGLTQEQIAESLGVTTPAVNKWEKGSTCPDIALLSPLARLLKTDLNTLLCFSENISQSEMTAICGRIRQTAQDKGIDSAFAAAKETLLQYPGNDKLLHTLAMQLQALLILSQPDEDQAQQHMKTIGEWYEILCGSDDPAIRTSSHHMLASFALRDGEYAEAQAHLDAMPNRFDIPDKRLLQAEVHLRRDKAAKAAELAERALMQNLSEMQALLLKLIDILTALGDLQSAEYAASRLKILADSFDLSPCNAAAGRFQLAVVQKDAKAASESFREMLSSLQQPWNMHDSPLFRRIAPSAASNASSALAPSLLKAFSQSPELSFLHGTAEFEALMEEYGAGCP